MTTTSTTTTTTTTIIKKGTVTVTMQDAFTYKVKVEGKRMRTFAGETAWSDAERYANDNLPWSDRVAL